MRTIKEDTTKIQEAASFVPWYKDKPFAETVTAIINQYYTDNGLPVPLKIDWLRYDLGQDGFYLDELFRVSPKGKTLPSKGAGSKIHLTTNCFKDDGTGFFDRIMLTFEVRIRPSLKTEFNVGVLGPYAHQRTIYYEFKVD